MLASRHLLSILRGCQAAGRWSHMPIDRPAIRSMLVLRGARNDSQIGTRRWMSSSYPDHKIIGLPKLSPSMDTGKIVAWKKKEGDFVEANSPLAEVETDKATLDFEPVDDFYLAKILVPEGTEDLKVGSPIAVAVEEESDVASFADFVLKDATPDAPAAEPAAEAAAPFEEEPEFKPETDAAPATAPATESPASSPSAVAQSTALVGTPPSSVAITPTPAQSTGDFDDVELTQFRKVTGDRLLSSKKTIPHYTLSMDCCIDEMVRQRKSINSRLREGESKISVNDFVLKATAAALRAVPEVNAQWTGDTIRQFHSIDLSVAVQTDRGLITPIIMGADQKGLKAISSEVRSLAQKAKDQTLKPVEFIGGTFTVSNLGMFGIDFFSAVINPPQAAILAVGTSEKRLVRDSSGSIEEKEYMNVTMSCDHRIIDGAIGARWLNAFKDNIEEPMNML